MAPPETKTFHFVAIGEGHFNAPDGQGSYISMTVTKDELGFERTHCIFPIPAQGWYLSGDEWEVNGTKVLSEQNGEFWIDPNFYDRYEDNTTFYYTFISSDPSTYTVTVKARHWFNSTYSIVYTNTADLDGNKWAGGTVGWTIAATNTPTISKSFKTGNVCQIYCWGHGRNVIIDWVDEATGQIIKDNFNQSYGSYSFTVTKNTTIIARYIEGRED